MDPVTAALFVGASFFATTQANKQSSKIESAQLRINTEQARLQIAEATYERTKQFRQNIAANLALSGTGVGGVSGFRGVAAESITNYFNDAAALGTQDLFAQARATAQKAGIQARKTASRVDFLLNAAQLSSQLGLFKPGKVK